MTNGFSEHNGDCPSTSHHEEGETAPELNDIDLGKLENKLIEELNSEEPPAFLLSPEPNQENGLPSQEESEPNLTLSDISISLDTPSSQDKPLDTPLHSAHSANPVPLIQLSTLPDQTSPISSPQIEHISSKPTSNIEKIKPEPIPESPITSVPTPQPLKNKPNLPGLQLNSELSSADSSPSPVGNVVQAGVTPPSSPRLFKVAPVVSQCINMDCKSDILCYDSNCLNSTVQSPEQRVEVSVKKESIDEETLLDDVWRTDDDCSSCMSGYTDATVDDLNVQIRVYQDLVSATLILDTLMVEKPKIKVSGKKMWIDSEDLSLYVLLPHLITSHTITVSKANVCIVLYKQHNALWGNLHIGHTKEEVFSYKFITEENTEILVESFGDPWYEATEYKLSTQCRTSSESTCVEYTVECPSNNAIPIIRQDSESEDVFPKGILKSISPHSPPPLSPRCRKVSFNEEVETFVLPSKRSLKRKGRRKKKNSNSESDFSDSCESLPSPSSPGPHSPVFSSDFELSNVQQNSHASANEMSKLKGNTVVDRSAPPPSPPSEPSSPPSSPSSSPEANSTEHNKENVMQTQQEVVKAMDPSGADSHKMLLTNSLIYELDD